MYRGALYIDVADYSYGCRRSRRRRKGYKTPLIFFPVYFISISTFFFTLTQGRASRSRGNGFPLRKLLARGGFLLARLLYSSASEGLTVF